MKIITKISKFNFCSNSKVVLTTPIFYVNASPHIGHLYTMIYTDSIREWLEINEKNVLFSTGTDEHGIKLQKKVITYKQH